MNNKGDNTHPCLNPYFTSNQSVSPSLVLTVAWLHMQRDWTAHKSSPKIPRSARHFSVVVIKVFSLIYISRIQHRDANCKAHGLAREFVSRYIQLDSATFPSFPPSRISPLCPYHGYTLIVVAVPCRMYAPCKRPHDAYD